MHIITEFQHNEVKLGREINRPTIRKTLTYLSVTDGLARQKKNNNNNN